MDLSPEQLDLNQVNQQLHELEAFTKTDLYTAFCQDFDKMALASVASLVDDAVVDIATLVNREQIIGEARCQRTSRNWFVDIHDALKARKQTILDELKLTEEEQDDARPE